VKTNQVSSIGVLGDFCRSSHGRSENVPLEQASDGVAPCIYQYSKRSSASYVTEFRNPVCLV
jgi:hypothetical protein